jgi:pimeloyl-ACP methyl ester carboxylesterase
MEVPEIRYAKSGEVSIAYQVFGNGRLDLVHIPGGFHHLELAWEAEVMAAFLRRLGTLGRVIRFDKRGTGMSDRMAELPTLETRMDDIRAVMDAAGSDRSVLFSIGADGGMLGALFAATYPERTVGLVLFNAVARQVRAPDMPWLRTRAELERALADFLAAWGDLTAFAEAQKRMAPSATDEELLQVARMARLSHSPGAAAAYLRANLDLDVRDILPSIRVPTLIMYRAGAVGDPFHAPQHARYLAERIPGARLVELPGADLSPSWGDQEKLFSELERFLSDVLEGKAAQPDPARVLATVLFTDIVDATGRAAQLGDRAWRDLLIRHHEAIRGQLASFPGQEMDTAGDGFFATFDGPARAIRCACAIRQTVREIGIQIRAGLHTGEYELIDGKASGIAVHLGARVASVALPGEILVSRTVKDLVAGSEINFHSRGTHELKGLGEWPLYAVANSDENTRTALADR